MIYSKINNDDVLFFQKAISDNNVFLDDKTLDEYSHDETEASNSLIKIFLLDNVFISISSREFSIKSLL